MEPNETWYEIKAPVLPDSPALLLYPERVEKNIRTLVESVGDVSLLRPHVKTCKAKEPIGLMRKAGITKFKCATIAEAETLASCGAEDVLLAYQPTEVKLQRFVALQKKFPHTRFSCLVDNFSSAAFFSAAAKRNGIAIAVFLDLNVGMNRTGIVADEQAFTLYKSIEALPFVKLAGLHAYDGQINEVDVQERQRSCEKCFVPVEQLRTRLAASGSFPLLIAGGSPTFQLHSSRKNVELSPGTFLFWDKSYRDGLPDQPFLFAALLLTRVISLPSNDTICIDLGHKSVASENPLHKRVFFLNAPHLQPVSHSEEHMVLEAGAGHRFKIGEVLYAVPFHVCPTVALYGAALTVHQYRVEGEWEIIARNRKISV